MVMSYEGASTHLSANVSDATRDQQASTPPRAEPARLETLRNLGWAVEARGCYWLVRRGHRQIELFQDGRVIFKDPTIRARYQLDDECLKVIRFVWPTVQF